MTDGGTDHRLDRHRDDVLRLVCRHPVNAAAVLRDPEQSLLYLMDVTNQRVWVLRRKDLQVMDRFGKPGRQAGEFIRAHMIAIDSQNRMYTGEAGNGRRMQRWILRGTKPAASVEPPVR